jgi:hypothetical protein
MARRSILLRAAVLCRTGHLGRITTRQVSTWERLHSACVTRSYQISFLGNATTEYP